MLAVERQENIVEMLRSDKNVLVADLAKKYFVSEATIRRDLEKLSKQKIIKRTYGGAVMLDVLNQPLPLNMRQREHWTEKNIITSMAARFINNYDVIIMDSSSTALSLVKHLCRVKDLTIITNGVRTAASVGEMLNCNLLCTGGECYDKTLSLVGTTAEAFLRKHNAKKLFFSCSSVTTKGFLANMTMDESNLKNVMIEQSEENYFLVDHSKLGCSSLCNVCSLQDVDNFITDCKPPLDWMQLFEKYDVNVIYPGSVGFEEFETNEA